MPISKTILTGTDHLSPLAWLLLMMIKGYRLIFSPVFSLLAQCRHYPTCSQYGLDAIRKYGAIKGAWMAAKRVARCNPWHPGGYDPVE